MADHLHPIDVGSCAIPVVHDGSLLPSTAVLAVARHVPIDRIYNLVGLDHPSGFRRVEQICRAEQYMRGDERRGDRGSGCWRD